MKHLVVVLCLILFTSSLAWGARGPADVSVGSHNLSSTGPNPGKYNTDEDSICVFCHTPHGGTLDAPLWNRNPAIEVTGWKHYNSATLSTNLQGLDASRAPNTESMICLSCHDGSLAINHVINEPNDRTTPIKGPGATDPTMIDFFGDPGSRIGGSPGIPESGGVNTFTDDHPFSFSYSLAMASPEYGAGQSKEGTLRDPGVAVSAWGVRFYTGALNVECGSCHDPHVNHRDNTEYSPFLITPNTGSLLCLACHIK